MPSVSTPDRRARDKDRDAAIEVVEAAWADGQIVQVDRDKRVEELLRAQTLQEIDLLVRDLQPPASQATSATPVASHSVTSPNTSDASASAGGGFQVRYGSSADTPDLEEVVAAAASMKTVRTSPRTIGLVVGLVVIGVVAAVIAGVVALVGNVRGAVDTATDSASAMASTTPLPGESPEVGVNLFTADGYDELLTDLGRDVGSTESFEVVLYPTYAVVYVPVDATSGRSALYYWNGTLDDLDSRTTSTEERFDLRDVDIDVVTELVSRVRGKVEDPTSWYAIVHAPGSQEGAAIWAYASNDYQETAYVGATPQGRIVYDSTKQ